MGAQGGVGAGSKGKKRGCSIVNNSLFVAMVAVAQVVKLGRRGGDEGAAGGALFALFPSFFGRLHKDHIINHVAPLLYSHTIWTAAMVTSRTGCSIQDAVARCGATYAATVTCELQIPNNVHFEFAGRQFCAISVARSILKVLYGFTTTSTL